MDETPVLRADALDDELDEEPDISDDYLDEVPTVLRERQYVIESYENGQGGWSFRRVVVP